jgi:hypothetical protein
LAVSLAGALAARFAAAGPLAGVVRQWYIVKVPRRMLEISHIDRDCGGTT